MIYAGKIEARQEAALHRRRLWKMVATPFWGYGKFYCRSKNNLISVSSDALLLE